MKLIFNIFDNIPNSLKLKFVQSEELEFDDDNYLLIDKENIEENEYIKSLLDSAYNDGYQNGQDDGYDEGYSDGELDGYEEGDSDGYNRGRTDI